MKKRLNTRVVILAVLLTSTAPTFAQDCNLPPRDCTGQTCDDIVPLQPTKGAGYDSYAWPADDHYARRDLLMLLQHAAALVECRAKDWTPGNRAPIGLGDMSRRDGVQPPGHPGTTHTGGRDMDIAYYQLTGSDNKLRAVCPSKNAHCVAKPNNLDVRRTALFIGTLLGSNRVRVVGSDPEIGPVLLQEMQKMCDAQTIPKVACDRAVGNVPDRTRRFSYSTGYWLVNHHHHMHVSLFKSAAPFIASAEPDEEPFVEGGDDFLEIKKADPAFRY